MTNNLSISNGLVAGDGAGIQAANNDNCIEGEALKKTSSKWIKGVAPEYRRFYGSAATAASR